MDIENKFYFLQLSGKDNTDYQCYQILLNLRVPMKSFEMNMTEMLQQFIASVQCSEFS